MPTCTQHQSVAHGTTQHQSVAHSTSRLHTSPVGCTQHQSVAHSTSRLHTAPVGCTQHHAAPVEMPVLDDSHSSIQAVSQSVSQSDNQPVSQSASQPTNQTVNQPGSHYVCASPITAPSVLELQSISPLPRTSSKPTRYGHSSAKHTDTTIVLSKSAGLYPNTLHSALCYALCSLHKANCCPMHTRAEQDKQPHPQRPT